MAITIAVDANLLQIGFGRLGSGGLMILKAYPWGYIEIHGTGM